MMTDTLENIATPLNEEELNDFKQFLENVDIDDDYELTLAEVHGFITGIICGPKIMFPPMWMMELFEGAPEFESDEEATRIINYLERIYNETSLAIESEQPLPEQYFPAHPSNLAHEKDYDAIAQWCSGFHDAITIDEEWQEVEVFFAIMLPILIGMSDEDDEILKDFSKDNNEEPLIFREIMIENINNAAHNLYTFMLNIKFRFAGMKPADMMPDDDEAIEEDESEEVILH